MTPAGPMAKTGNGSPEPPDLPPPTESTSNSKSTSVQTVASVASGATSPSLTSLLCHRHPTAPPSRQTTAPPSRNTSREKSEGYDHHKASKHTLGYYKTTLPVLISEIDLDSEPDEDSE